MANEKRVYLQHLRKKRGLSTKDISTLTGISESTYKCYEAGIREPNIERMAKIAKVMKENDVVKLFKKGGVILATSKKNNSVKAGK